MFNSMFGFQRVSIAAVAAVTLSACGVAPSSMPALSTSTEGSLLSPSVQNTRIPTGTVTGRIIDDHTQIGVAQVLVQVQNVNPPVQTLTDSSGNFVLNNVPQGQQYISVNKADYVYTATAGSIIANVMPNQTVALAQIQLSPAIAVASNAYLTSIGSLNEPYGLAIDNNHGALYCVDHIGINNILDKRSEVKKYNLTGGFEKSFGGNKLGAYVGQGDILPSFSHLSWAYGVDVDTGGNVYVADMQNDRVVKFSGDGTYINKVSDNLTSDYDVAVMNTGQVAVSSGGTSKVVLFDTNLVASGQDFAGTSNSASVNGGLRGITVDAGNSVYVLDQSGGTGNVIKKYDGKGGNAILHFGTMGGSGNGQFSGPTDLAVDPRNNDIYVVDAGNSRVQRFNRDGNFISTFGVSGSGNGYFDRPYGIAIDKNGYVYVSDTGNKRIEKFAPGRITDGTTGYTSSFDYPTK